MAPIPPLCWKCRYDLTGSYVEANCPECGTPVWSSPPTDQIVPDTFKALYGAGLGLALLFVWLGPSAPLALAAGLYAMGHAERVTKATRFGRVAHVNLTPARHAFWVGLGTVVAASWLSMQLLFDAVEAFA
jgi:hypothetical protein